MKKLNIFLVLYYSLFISHYSLSQWIQMSGGIGANQAVNSFTSNGNYIFAGTGLNGVFRSSDNGENWNAVNNGLTNFNITSLISKSNILFAGTAGGGIFKSIDNGDNWFPVNSGLSNMYIQSFGSRDSIILAGTSTQLNNPGGAYYTNNSGVNWNNMALVNLTVKTFTSSGNFILAGTSYSGISGIFRSTNYGINWTAVNGGLSGYQHEVNALASDGSNIYAGTNYGVYLSNNYGSNWISRNYGVTPGNINCLTLHNSIIFIGKQDGFFVTKNYGALWEIKNQGFTSTPWVNSIYVFNNFIFLGTNGQSVWRRGFNEIINVKKISEVIPVSYSLYQNYPNPFNPNTKIKFSIPRNEKSETSNVKLVIYDVQGREVEVILNDNLKPGMYEVDFNGGNLSSGLYFCNLKTEDFSKAIKMTLIK